ncbi:GNAT family N-acetyltransferase [Bacillus carboniphilus]|uniref:GNAT family N-acetyltransferase n=1 Tax=Bacillus carboniphilus TaxID=86663 RepID=A0ABN0WK76_9BACI
MNVTMKTTLHSIQLNQKPVLENLLQYYFYDFSEFNSADVTETGKFGDYPYTHLYWEEEGRYPYFIYYDEKLAGFALVSKEKSEGNNYFSISEFFVLKKFRRLGVGREAAITAFSEHRGEWEVFQMASNQPAQKFWRRVIHEFTNGEYVEKVDEKRVTQLFKS